MRNHLGLRKKRSPHNRLKQFAHAICLSAAAIFLMAGGAVAAEKDKAKSDTIQLKAVKVTANKMEEDPMDVPQAISVISEIELQEKGIKGIPDVIEQVPGMTFSRNHGTAVNFRGLNASLFTQNNPVVMYVDGIGYSGSTGFDTSLVNVERVEVLRAAQSTLYGKDAMGAVINVVTKDPTNTWQGKVGGEYGSYHSGNMFMSLNGPIFEDTLFLGFSGQYETDQGWIKNEFTGMDYDANAKRNNKVNGYLLYTPNDDLRIRLSLRREYDKQYWMDEYAMAPGSTLDDFDADDAKKVSFDVQPKQTITDNSQSLHVEYTAENFKVDSITTHHQQNLDAIYDGDFTDTAGAWRGLTMFDDKEIETWGQEFRFSSLQEEGFRWTTGVYMDMDTHEQGPYGADYVWGGARRSDAHSDAESYTMAGFGQIMAPITDNLELTLGARFQKIHKEIDLKTYDYALGGAPVQVYEMDASQSWTELLPKAALTYDFNDNWTSYLSYSHGYMPGGFNNYAMGGSVDDNMFDPERSITYEWGVKAAYDNFRMGTALYYMDIEDIHVFRIAGPMYLTDNAKKAHSMGIEVEATYLPIETLELSGAISVMQAEYDDYDNGIKQFDGERIEQTPSHTVSLSAMYRDPSGFYARLDGRYVGTRTFFDGRNQGFTEADAYTEFDTKVGYRFDGFDVYAYIDNITDAGYVTAFRSNATVTLAGVSEPRKFGMGLQYNF